jgi:hypothetical protein
MRPPLLSDFSDQAPTAATLTASPKAFVSSLKYSEQKVTGQPEGWMAAIETVPEYPAAPLPKTTDNGAKRTMGVESRPTTEQGRCVLLQPGG